MAFLPECFRYAPVARVQPQHPMMRFFRLPFSPFNFTASEESKYQLEPGANGHRRRAIRPASLIAFNFFLSAFCVGLVLAWHFSETLHGYDIGGANKYLLTYGPTAVFVCIVAFWRQIDYAIKADTPWIEILNGHASATNSLLIDYVSPFQVTALWHAISHGHISVSITIIGFVALKLATLFSTGLLTIDDIDVQQSLAGLTATAITTQSLAVNNATNHDKSLLYTTYGILVEDLEKPFGLDEGIAYSTFSLPPALPPNFQVETEVNAFVPSFDCQVAQLSAPPLDQNTTDPFPKREIDILHPQCSWTFRDTVLRTLNPQNYRCPERQLGGFSKVVACDPSVFGSQDNASDVYQMIVLADVRYGQSLTSEDATVKLSQPVRASSWNTSIAAITGVVCRLTYNMQRVVAVANNTDLEHPSLSFTGQDDSNYRLDNLTDLDLDHLYRGAISVSDEIFGSRSDQDYSLEYPDPLLKIMARISGGRYTDLLNATAMSLAASRVTTQLIAQVAHQYLRTNSSQPMTMTAAFSSVRLRVATVSAWVVFGSMLFLFALNCWLWFLLRRQSLRQPFESIGGAAPVPYHNQEFDDKLVTSQGWTEKQLEKALRNTEVLLTFAPDQSPEISLSGSFPTHEGGAHNPHWWSPMTVSVPMLGLTFALALIGIAVLEILQHYSDTRHGFTRFDDSSSYTETIYLHLLPALAVLAVASLFNCLDFNAMLLAPYDAMRASVPENRLTARPLISQTPLVGLWQSCRQRSWGTVTSSLAAMVGSLMTIVVSGLYGIEAVQSAGKFPITIIDTLNPVWTNSATEDSGAALISSLTENLQFPDPIGTSGELFFPRIDLGQPSVSYNASIAAMIPSWRADLSCEALSPSAIDINPSQNRIQNSLAVNITYDLPPSCLFGGPNGNETILEFTHTFNYALEQNTSYIGKLLNIHVGPYDSITDGTTGEASPVMLGDNPLGCPSIALIYGYFDSLQVAEKPATDSIVVELCYQKLQKLSTNVTFANSSLAIDARAPPVPNEDSLFYVTLNASSNETGFTADSELATSFQFRPQNHFDDSFAIFNTSGQNPFVLMSASTGAVDTFFQGVLFGKSPVALTTLQFTEQSDKGRVRTAILSFYRRYMAQAMNSNMRAPISDRSSSDSQTQEAIAAEGVIHRRVVQQRTSKILLQSMLAFMALCGGVTILTVKLHKLLPATTNPCSIWGQMSMWAGSRYLVQYKEKELRNSSDKDANVCVTEAEPTSHMFRLGWWPMLDGRKRYGIDIVDAN